MEYQNLKDLHPTSLPNLTDTPRDFKEGRVLAGETERWYRGKGGGGGW